MIPDTLQNTLRALRLSGLHKTLAMRLQEATANQLSHQQFLELLLQDELSVRRQRKIERRTKLAGFREQQAIEQFDFAFNKVDRARIYQLATCEFVRDAGCVLFVGPPGVGKSHLAQALGAAAIRHDHTVLYRSVFDVARDFMKDEALQGDSRILQTYLKTDLLIVDDMGMKELPRKSGEYLMEVVMRRHGLKSTIMTSNRPIEDWGKLLGDNASATAILDRFLEQAELITITGRSYRMQRRSCNQSKDSVTVSTT